MYRLDSVKRVLPEGARFGTSGPVGYSCFGFVLTTVLDPPAQAEPHSPSKAQVAFQCQSFEKKGEKNLLGPVVEYNPILYITPQLIHRIPGDSIQPCTLQIPGLVFEVAPPKLKDGRRQSDMYHGPQATGRSRFFWRYLGGLGTIILQPP
ncbi:hypothetical protein C8R45DRAFT_151580 [Mycena sanguinolenta]|nr:hypothetical protein C8R45DRAFT_151580 [Mycena sanguinolenta]